VNGRPPLGASLEDFGLDREKIIFVPNALQAHPELAVQVMTVLSHWAWTEYELTTLVTGLLKADFAVASEFAYQTGWERRRNAIKALAT